MKIILDMNLSPQWSYFLQENGHETKHWSEVGDITAYDTEIMEWARKNNHIVFTHDLDFGALLFATNASAPSVIQLRAQDIRPEVIGKNILLAIRLTEKELQKGALITIDPKKNRIRLLPLK